jgi:hypothetical protein
MKYKCINKECKMYNVEVTTGLHIKYDKNDNEIDMNKPCPSCSQPRERLEEESKGLCTTTHGRNNVPNK